MTAPVLQVENLGVSFGVEPNALHAVREVSFSLSAGETLCLVGESGSGKSVTALALLNLLPPRSARISASRLALEGRSLLGLGERELSHIRGKAISMIFQEPMSSLNPALTVGYQLAEAVRLHGPVSAAAARRDALAILDKVRIPDAARRLDEYPHQLSGGMRQRVMIAMALACRPRVLIADEPTTALDVTVQAQILELIGDLKADFGTAVLFITHDLGVVAEIADRVAVMYAGRIVEEGEVSQIFDDPAHGYTHGLLSTLAVANRHAQRLPEIPGSTPRILGADMGCSFAPRCAFAEPQCRTMELHMAEIAPGHVTRCRRAAIVRGAKSEAGHLAHG